LNIICVIANDLRVIIRSDAYLKLPILQMKILGVDRGLSWFTLMQLTVFFVKRSTARKTKGLISTLICVLAFWVSQYFYTQ